MQKEECDKVKIVIFIYKRYRKYKVFKNYDIHTKTVFHAVEETFKIIHYTRYPF